VRLYLQESFTFMMLTAEASVAVTGDVVEEAHAK
jgi:uncharacterized linocin/CFP29 family protein